MTLFQILMLGASAFFAYKIYQHIGTLKDPQRQADSTDDTNRSADAFSAFDSSELIEKGDEQMRKGDLDKALAIYSEANIKEPNNDEVLFKMGYSLSKQERYEEALEYYKEALALDKENPFTHFEMAQVYIAQDEFASARTHLNAALELDPELSSAAEALEKLNKEH
jgi:tetratricopeptide (TPR) repeat protein